MSHSHVGAAATSASAAGASGGERVPKTIPVCARLLPWVCTAAYQRGSCVCTHMCPSYTCLPTDVCLGSGGAYQPVGRMPSLGTLAKFASHLVWSRGGETGRSRFPPTRPTHGAAGRQLELFVGL